MKFFELLRNKAARSWSIRLDFKLFVLRFTVTRSPTMISLNQHRIPMTKSYVQVIVY